MKDSGIINLLKPAGMTSHDCVDFMRKLTGIRRIGHTGTLDPMATGVLVICLGKTTRIIEYLENDDKEYLGEMVLGLTTESQDIWGQVIAKADEKTVFPESLEEISRVMKSFEGEILQEAPAYSAVRVEGKRLYEYARAGMEVPSKKRQVKIYRLNVIDYNKEKVRVRFSLACSKGTYVRTICHELGVALGTGAAMSFLLRTGSGVFRSENAVSLEELKTGYEKYLLAPDYPLGHFARLDLDAGQARDFCQGKVLKSHELQMAGQAKGQDQDQAQGRKYCVYSDNKFLGIGEIEESIGAFKAEKVLCQ